MKHYRKADACVVSNGEESAMIWHLKLGHMSEQSLKILSERNLLPRLKSTNLPFSEHCITSKQNRLKFSRHVSRSKCIIDLVHSDIWESPNISMRGVKYLVTFINNYSRKRWVCPIKKKLDVLPVFKQYKTRVELEFGKKSSVWGQIMVESIHMANFLLSVRKKVFKSSSRWHTLPNKME